MGNQAERRELTFQNLDEVVAEVERLAAGEVRTTGKHNFGQILNHLALAHDVSSGRIHAPPPPFFMRAMMPLIRRMVISTKPLKPGVKLPASGEAYFWPDKEFDIAAEVEHLKNSVEYYKTHGPLAKHPFFGKLSAEEADQLNCRHAALHLSFVHPVLSQ
ncbi:DUF1569 domain-containing protein [Roseimaritima ulvae]|uniref:DUF1569 domain-containing protein n=1 Tax=Roseimaritima ulvae TaxID=980254 RepID=A0A5B9QPJ2_9BACT|nr:DUF1569 domain-containing protein [Roseimaritima ulvae]QEG41007.1 hypothetical protein UC8_30250 [Roseimaritima ulvae]